MQTEVLNKITEVVEKLFSTKKSSSEEIQNLSPIASSTQITPITQNRSEVQKSNNNAKNVSLRSK